MRYKIIYGPVSNQIKRNRFFQRQCLIAVCLLLIIVAMNKFYPKGIIILRQYLLPAGDVPTCIENFWEETIS